MNDVEARTQTTNLQNDDGNSSMADDDQHVGTRQMMTKAYDASNQPMTWPVKVWGTESDVQTS